MIEENITFYKNHHFKLTEIGEIPEEWEVVRLGEVVKERKETVDDRNIEPIAVGEKGVRKRNEIYYKELTKNYNKYKIFRYGDLCFGLGTKKMAVGVNSYKDSVYCVSPAYKVFEINTNFYFIIFFDYFIQLQQKLWGDKFLVQSVRQGKKVDLQRLFKVFIPLPPLPEQKAIAFVLSTIQEAKEKTEQVIQTTKELKKSMMKHLFTYGPVSLKEAKKVKLKETEIGMIPEEWEVVRLGDIVKTYSGGTPNRAKKEYFKGKIGWLKSGELNDNFVFSTEESITAEALKNSSAKYVENNVLLIAMYGATAGKVGLAKSKFTINQAICAIVPNNKFNSEFYFYYLQTIRDKLLTQRFGGAQPNLNQQIIKNLKIPLPPLPIQQKIAEILSKIDEKIQAEEKKKQAIENLFKSMLHNLMSGKIRVKNE